MLQRAILRGARCAGLRRLWPQSNGHVNPSSFGSNSVGAFGSTDDFFEQQLKGGGNKGDDWAGSAWKTLGSVAQVY